MLIGDLLALGSAVAFGLYSVVGRRERNSYPLLSYALGLYGTATLWLAPAAVWQFTGAYSLGNVTALASLGILPLGTGHTLYNAALRRIKATYVNILATQEVFGGIALGWLVLGEVPSSNALAGVAVTLVGVALVLL
ncbi:MAG: DMT family transporter [Chloroflexi bacterium]|nr:DMT family transporter [Chloroflexota bacterium]